MVSVVLNRHAFKMIGFKKKQIKCLDKLSVGGWKIGRHRPAAVRNATIWIGGWLSGPRIMFLLRAQMMCSSTTKKINPPRYHRCTYLHFKMVHFWIVQHKQQYHQNRWTQPGFSVVRQTKCYCWSHFIIVQFIIFLNRSKAMQPEILNLIPQLRSAERR